MVLLNFLNKNAFEQIWDLSLLSVPLVQSKVLGWISSLGIIPNYSTFSVNNLSNENYPLFWWVNNSKSITGEFTHMTCSPLCLYTNLWPHKNEVEICWQGAKDSCASTIPSIVQFDKKQNCTLKNKYIPVTITIRQIWGIKLFTPHCPVCSIQHAESASLSSRKRLNREWLF